jgi:hypothetical protein
MENKKGQDFTVWSKEQFLNEIWEIHPEGNSDWVYNVMVASVKNHKYTFEQIKDKFKEYIDSLAPFQNGKYTTKEKRIKPLENFLNEYLYKQDYIKNVKATNPIRDYYLYGI